MIELLSVSVPFEYKDGDLATIVAKELKIATKDVKSVEIKKRSVDARKGLKYVMSFRAEVRDETAVKTSNTVRRISADSEYHLPTRMQGNSKKVIVVGAGPAGLFCALSLAHAGLNPVVVERGKTVDERARDVESFFAGADLDSESNVQFGEGGAGTFSDGKLNTGVNDERIRFVLKTFVECGADQDVVFDALPHVGTDKLRTVVKNIRQRIVDLGGSFEFETKLTDIKVAPNGRISAVALEKGGQRLWRDVDVLVLAIGHSARDTYKMLDQRGVFMEPKAFSLGVRVEHLACDINQALYHRPDVTAPYKLSHRLANGRGVYTFCMCPGGYVVNASSESGQIAVNGMSNRARDGENSNSAVLVSVGPDDFPVGALGGMELQRQLEAKAYAVSGSYRAPAQTLADFVDGRKTLKFGKVKPTVRPEPVCADLNALLPGYVAQGIKEGMVAFGRKVKGFDAKDTVLTGVETRSSAPVRLVRTDGGESLFNPGIYPAGEGAGYAGGITSSAVDGLKVAEKILGIGK